MKSLYKIELIRTHWYERLRIKINYYYHKIIYGITCNCPCHYGIEGFYDCWIDCCDTPNLNYKKWKTVSHIKHVIIKKEFLDSKQIAKDLLKVIRIGDRK